MIVAGMLARRSPRNKVSAARIKMQSDGAAAYGGRRQTLRGFHEPVTDSRSLFSRCQLTEPIEILRISQQQEVFKQQLFFFPCTPLRLLFFVVLFFFVSSFDGSLFKARLLADHPTRPPRFADLRGTLKKKRTSRFIKEN